MVNWLVLKKFPIWALTLGWDSASGLFSLSGITESLILLTVFVYGIVWLTSPHVYGHWSIHSVAWGLSLILMVCFRVSGVFPFYFLFEASLLPMFFMVLGWGYQPERLPAGMSLILYTVLASLPLLVLVVSLYVKEGTSSFMSLNTPGSAKEWAGGSSLVSAAAVLGFLVKLPMFWLHLWLPKAHVEASVEGSMFLASILLKLGGYGIFRFIKMVDSSLVWSGGVAGFAVLGGAWMGLLCARQTDLKVLIAYSSVAHMSMVIYGISTGTNLGLWASVSLMLAHGATSSGLFMAANLVYARTNTRSLLLSKNLLNVLPCFSIFWFLLCVANMGGPPTFNLLSEVMNFVLACSINKASLLPFSAMAAVSVVYSLILYSLSQHGAALKLCSSPRPLSSSVIVNLSYHMALTILMVMVASSVLE